MANKYTIALALAAVMGLLLASTAYTAEKMKPTWEENFGYEKVARIAELDAERTCVAKSETRAEMRACAK